MKVLMFGWEFPPHISGGLGTACYGLSKALAKTGQVELVFVVPRTFGDEKKNKIRLIGANKIQLRKGSFHFEEIHKRIGYIEIDSLISPYISEKEYFNLKSDLESRKLKTIENENGVRIDFSGKYGSNLMAEIEGYSMVAENIASETDFDIIHAHDWLTFRAGIAASNASGKPLVVHVHATEYDRSGGNINPAVYAIEREGLEAADRIIAVSNFTKSTLIERYEITEDKIQTVYNAVEPLQRKRIASRNKAFNDKVVTFLGRITMQKGPEYFVEAANLVLRKMKNVRFVMAGSGDMFVPMVERIAELGISDRFHFTGFLKGSDVDDMYALTDVFVMPSVSEPFGIVPLEAMQAKVPVIISNQSGVSEILSNALKVDFWDTFAMADAIYGLLNYPSLVAELIDSGEKEVGNLKWKNAAKKVINVYTEVLESNRN